MRYHRLSGEDLAEFEEEFKTFLATNGIDAPTWQALKQSDTARTGALLDQFSDLVIHRALTNIQALKMVAEKEIYVFRFAEKEAEVLHLTLPREGEAAFTDAALMESIANGERTIQSLTPEIEKGTKKLKGDRELEMYMLMRQGAEACPASFFEDFKKMLA